MYSLSPSPPRDEVPNQSSLSTATSTYPTALSENTITADTSIGVPHLTEGIVSPPQSLPQNDTSYDTPTVEQSYVGRSEYLGGQVPFTEDTTAPQRNHLRGNELSDLDAQILSLRKAFDLPPRTIRESLVDAFMERCHPWMPIVERHWLEDREHPPSLLLLQAVFLAGSRVLSSPLVHTTSSEFYERAKALFFSGHEQNRPRWPWWPSASCSGGTRRGRRSFRRIPVGSGCGYALSLRTRLVFTRSRRRGGSGASVAGCGGRSW